MKYLPYGVCRNSQPEIEDFPTDKLFTGQRLDSTGLYYYNARYYDPTIGRFISADIIVPNQATPQAFNRYSYCLNNPLEYIDPSGYDAYLALLQHYEKQPQIEDYAGEYSSSYSTTVTDLSYWKPRPPPFFVAPNNASTRSTSTLHHPVNLHYRV